MGRWPPAEVREGRLASLQMQGEIRSNLLKFFNFASECSEKQRTTCAWRDFRTSEIPCEQGKFRDLTGNSGTAISERRRRWGMPVGICSCYVLDSRERANFFHGPISMMRLPISSTRARSPG